MVMFPTHFDAILGAASTGFLMPVSCLSCHSKLPRDEAQTSPIESAQKTAPHSHELGDILDSLRQSSSNQSEIRSNCRFRRRDRR